MSGVWVFDNGVIRLAEGGGGSRNRGRNVLIYTATNEAMTTLTVLKNKLLSLGWEIYYEDAEIVQFHKPSSVDLISLPTDFSIISLSLSLRDVSFVPSAKLPFIYMDPKARIPIKKRYLFIPPHIIISTGIFHPVWSGFPQGRTVRRMC
ncbi:Flowering-promoting factor 1-like protein 2, partial [Cucurbita argyrosperma subsp. argyrosperma]